MESISFQADAYREARVINFSASQITLGLTAEVCRSLSRSVYFLENFTEARCGLSAIHAPIDHRKLKSERYFTAKSVDVFSAVAIFVEVRRNFELWKA